VLAAPPARGFNLLVWVLPLLGLAAAGAAIAVLARRSTRRARETGAAGSDDALDPKLARRLDDELALYDR
jgi:cytochrome c-type biogenesis protein CcmH/NrfF